MANLTSFSFLLLELDNFKRVWFNFIGQLAGNLGYLPFKQAIILPL